VQPGSIGHPRGLSVELLAALAAGAKPIVTRETVRAADPSPTTALSRSIGPRGAVDSTPERKFRLNCGAGQPATNDWKRRRRE